MLLNHLCKVPFATQGDIWVPDTEDLDIFRGLNFNLPHLKHQDVILMTEFNFFFKYSKYTDDEGIPASVDFQTEHSCV